MVGQSTGTGVSRRVAGALLSGLLALSLSFAPTLACADTGEGAADAMPPVASLEDVALTLPDDQTTESDQATDEAAPVMQGTEDQLSADATADGGVANEVDPVVAGGAPERVAEDDASGPAAPDAAEEPAPLAVDEQEAPPATHEDGWAVDDDGISYWRGGRQVRGWVVTQEAPDGTSGGLNRYWLDADGHLAMGRVISPDEGDGAWWAYARPEGPVVRGAYGTTDGDGNEIVYLADQDGRMPSRAGWLVSSAYGQGLQRYYLQRDEATGACVTRVGASMAGWAHCTRPEGYVVRGTYRSGSTVYLADQDGRAPTRAGWLVSSAYGQGLQRYYLHAVDGGISAARVGYSTDGWAHCTRPQGYVVRGTYRSGSTVYLADQDGRAPTRAGWLVSSAYGHGLQRYYLQRDEATGACVARVGGSKASWDHYTRPEGYVVRGRYKSGSDLYLADQDGRLLGLSDAKTGSRPLRGWLVSGALTSGTLQRYYLYRVAGDVYAARPGASSDGWPHYTRPEGYVVRGTYKSGTTIYLADNEGRAPAGGGWRVTGVYTKGVLQRYYLYRIEGGIAVARAGLSSDGYLHFTTDDGYVMRNTMRPIDGTWYRANNDGLLTKTVPVDIIQSLRPSLEHGYKGPEHQRYIVLHDTEGGGNAWNIIDGWLSSGSAVASHFIVNRDGSVVQCVSMDQIAHHAGFGDTGHNGYYGISESSRDDRRGTVGIGSWASDYGMNAWSIGIELVHSGNQAYPEAQLRALDGLIAYIDGYYGFESTIIDHKMWRSGNSDTSPAFAGYLANYRRTRTHDGSTW